MIVFLSVWLLAIALSAQSPSNITPLEPETVIERPLSTGEEHLYQLSLAKGEYVSVTVEQHGIDVTVETRRCDGSSIADFQDENRHQGQEQVEEHVGRYGGGQDRDLEAGLGVAIGVYAVALPRHHLEVQ